MRQRRHTGLWKLRFPNTSDCSSMAASVAAPRRGRPAYLEILDAAEWPGATDHTGSATDEPVDPVSRGDTSASKMAPVVVPKPPAEVHIDTQLVADLLAEQHPDLGHLDVIAVAEGWDACVFTVGDHLSVRLPRRAEAAASVLQEHRWLPRLAPRLSLEISCPRRIGRPGPGFPWHWSVNPWFAGRSAAVDPPADQIAAADALARFVSSLAKPAPPDAPPNPLRGVALQARAESFALHRSRLDPLLPLAEIDRLWADLSGRADDTWPGSDIWLHGDLHPGNLVVRDGELVAVIDFTDLTSGDPASDLAVAWMLFDDPVANRRFFDHTPHHDHATRRRARAWALVLSVAMLANSADEPVIRALGRRTLTNVLDPDQA